MGLKSILHTLIDHIDESAGVDKSTLHEEVDNLSSEIESNPTTPEPSEAEPGSETPSQPESTEGETSPGESTPEPGEAPSGPPPSDEG
jgi:hypothetical protein